MKKFTKITVGHVSQTFVEQEDGSYRCDNQAFIAADDCTFENDMGEVVNAKDMTSEMESAYCNFEMKQPEN